VGVPVHLAPLHQRFLLEEGLAHLRHDIRNKLGAIRNAAFYLRRKTESDAVSLWRDDPRVPRFFGLIASEVEDTEKLLGARGQLLDDAPATSAVDGQRLLREQLAARADGVPIVLDGAAIELPAAEQELAIALHCLIDNAIEAGARSVRVGCGLHGGAAVLSVEDDGPQAAPDRAFEPFFSTKPGRLGLGLNVVRRIASRWGGDVELTRAANAGTRAALVFRG